ncbi:hypothetical protein QTI24_26635 [Variovorax sp. J22P240]|uniref:hypothetical protein n=1 Tax=Variovorax sp. J22P240 TaxID=3053514 RepID=UPI00257571FE|nr:hypothetical protein [Variovorax sp. J22P240]MDM0002210.1 hypothetical protein [Variovorax sp. J22P240]
MTPDPAAAARRAYNDYRDSEDSPPLPPTFDLLDPATQAEWVSVHAQGGDTVTLFDRIAEHCGA